MLILKSPSAVLRALERPPDGLSGILNRYLALLTQAPIATLFVVQPGDTTQDLASVRNRPFEYWEFIELEGGWYEAVFIVSDDGFGHVVLVPDRYDTDPDLLAICKSHAVA